jgi:GTP-binding protein HflX
VGYTNAGKSSLLNLLTGEKVIVEELLFSTLSTKTSRLKKKSSPPILITDTVGFIRNLPSWVIDAFHSTLEEISVADLILLVVDVSEKPDTVRKKLETSMRELKEIDATVPMIVVFNKIDKLSEGEIRERMERVRDLIEGVETVEISVKERKNIDKLLEAVG